MKEVDISLDLMKSVYNSRMEKCDERRLLYEVKQAKMRDQVQKFEEFIKENDAKRVRAEAKAKNEKLSVAGKCKELSALQHEIEELNDSRGKLVIELGENN
jgi:predicted  nucleic acid-binding Zn-ribbon protein